MLASAVDVYKMVPDMAHSLPADIPVPPGVHRTPKTPRGSNLEPRFYPVIKDATVPDAQVRGRKRRRSHATKKSYLAILCCRSICTELES